MQNDTANNADNALRSMGSIPKIVSNPYLTDQDAWFVRTNVKEGMKFFQREAPMFTSDNEFDTMNLRFKVYERFVPGWSDERALFGSEGA